MSEISKNNEFYKKKYLKYKSKYLELKKKNNIEDIQVGTGVGSLASSPMTSAMNLFSSNTNAAAGIMGSVASGISSLNLSNGLKNIAFAGFETFLSKSPQYQELVHLGFMTPQNKEIIVELLKLFISHLTDPSFYPIMTNLITNILVLIGSAETLNAFMVLSALKNLNYILEMMKLKYPNDFILLSTFLRNNKDKIFKMIHSRGFFGDATLKIQFEIFMKFIEISPEQQISQPPI